MKTEEGGEVAPRSRWTWPFTWLGLLALAWLIIELTHQPALGAIAVCLKFGWEDFRAARWLWRHDGDRWRRCSTFYLYLAWGLWKTALVAFFMSLGFAFVAPANLPVAAPAPAVLLAFLGTFLTTLAGFALSAMMTGLAVACAWRGGVRLWLDSAVHRARRLDCWPPAPCCEGRRNRLGHLLLTALGLGFLFVLVVLLSAAVGGVASVLLCFVLSITAPVAMLLCRELISHKVWAESPYECWDELPEEEDLQQARRAGEEEPWQESTAVQ
jgi:hypothetical protein